MIATLESRINHIRGTNRGRRAWLTWAAFAAGVLARPAAALPTYGIVDCAECHSTAQPGLTLTNYQALVDLGAGWLPVFQASAGQTVALSVNVTNDYGGPYGLNFNGFAAAGFSNSNDHMVFAADTNWTSEAGGTYYTVGPISPGDVPQIWTFNLEVETGTPPDYYPLQVFMAGASTCMWSESQMFYLQILAPLPPAPVAQTASRLGGSFSVRVATTSGFTYFLEYTTSLVGGTWTPVAETPGDGTVKTLVDPAATDPARLYRVRVQ